MSPVDDTTGVYCIEVRAVLIPLSDLERRMKMPLFSDFEGQAVSRK